MKTLFILLLLFLIAFHNVDCIKGHEPSHFFTKANSVIPTDGMVITKDTTFTKGTYNLPNGISIGVDGITIDMNGATFIGSFSQTNRRTSRFGIIVSGRTNVTIINGNIRGYFYGIGIESSSSISIDKCTLSNNWMDPKSRSSNPPWLNLNVIADLDDLTNLGGGIFMNNVIQASITNNQLCNQENGIDMFYVTESSIVNNNASSNTGWGFHLHNSQWNSVTNNIVTDCSRSNLGDAAAFLLNNNSNFNRVLRNMCQRGSNGFLIGDENAVPSNDNLIADNDCSYAKGNAFEATFSSRNIFRSNVASFSTNGFSLDYSHSDNYIASNEIFNNSANGIQITNGQSNMIIDNKLFFNGQNGILLKSDSLTNFPALRFSWLNLTATQNQSAFYTIEHNQFYGNLQFGLRLIQTTDSVILNNVFNSSSATGTAKSDAQSVRNNWNNADGLLKEQNIIGGPYIGGNYWSNYKGKDTTGDGIGDTMIPYSNSGNIEGSDGDSEPLVPHEKINT